MPDKPQRLRKGLKLFDVYVISTGAMFSSGFFLLPGIAAAKTGSSVILAYLISGALMLPALLSKAELATAMPRAGGVYYFLDRTLGPAVGTIGGVGSWLALILKSAFALIGMGAYLGIFFDVDIKAVAVSFTLLFMAINIAGAKETTGVLRVLVVSMLVILSLFIAHGLVAVGGIGFAESVETRFAPFLTDGVDGLLGTVGLVFVSYVGLTKVASLAEEIEHPDRNIPLGMALSLFSVVTVYIIGIFIMIAVLGIDGLSASLTPVADSAAAFFSWLPARWGQMLMVVAAVAAFASMSNAGIMAASRYPLAMARDQLFPGGFARLGRWHTPVNAIMITCVVMVLFLLVFDVVSVAKLAGALQLSLFALINLAVIVMRESRIESYDPGFKSPLYPWVQFVGVIAPVMLIGEMGWLPVWFTLGVAAASFLWYRHYAQDKIARDGAIFHVFERLGKRRFAGLDLELRGIMKEKGARAADPFDQAVARAFVVDHAETVAIDDVIEEGSRLLARRAPLDATTLADRFRKALEIGGVPIGHGVALFHTRAPGLESSEMVFARCVRGVESAADRGLEDGDGIHAIFFLISGDSDPGQHLRILAHLAGRVEEDGFLPEWLADSDEQDLKETLLRDDRFLTLVLAHGHPSEELIGLALRDLRMPEGCLVALIRRRGVMIVPHGATVLRDGDRLTVIGEPGGLAKISAGFGNQV